MESLEELSGQAMKRLRESSQSNSELTRYENEISIYRGELTTPCVIKNIARVKAAFPSLPKEFYKAFSERIIDNNFNDDRLRDAVNHVIDTCVYPIPTIAQFISFDKKFKVYHYEDMLKKANEFGPGAWGSYKVVKFPDREKIVWVHVDDIKMYNLKPETDGTK